MSLLRDQVQGKDMFWTFKLIANRILQKTIILIYNKNMNSLYI